MEDILIKRLAEFNDAILHNDISRLRKLMNTGSHRNDDNELLKYAIWSALHWGIKNQNVQLVEVLVQANGAYARSKDHVGDSCLHHAAKVSNPALVSLFIPHVDVDAVNSANKTPLHVAVEHEQLDAVTILLKQKANINVHNGDVETPLHIAVKKNNCYLVELLLVSGAIANLKCKNGETVLHLAMRHSSDKIIKKILESNDVDINARDDQNMTPLHSLLDALVGNKKSVELARLLVEKGAKLNAKTICGDTPLHIAVMKRNLEATEYLLSVGANVNEIGSKGCTPIYYAVREKDYEMVAYLINAGANVNHMDESDHLPVFKAIRTGSERIVELLIDNGSRRDFIICQSLHPIMDLMYFIEDLKLRFNMITLLIEKGFVLEDGPFYSEMYSKQLKKAMECQEELERMKKTKICAGSNVTYFDIIDDMSKVCQHSRCSDIVREMESGAYQRLFVHFSRRLKIKFARGSRRLQLIDLLTECLGHVLLHEIILIIVKFISEMELERMIFIPEEDGEEEIEKLIVLSEEDTELETMFDLPEVMNYIYI